MVRDLAVFLHGRRVGTISQGNGLTFHYSTDYLASDSPTPLSLSMPLGDKPLRNRITRAWIAGLLPADRTVRLRIAERGGVNPRNPVDLLSVVGLDCPGAVQTCWADRTGEVDERNAALRTVDEEWIGQRIARFSRDEASWQIADERWSIGGGQSKFTLTRTATGWADPVGSAPSTHIIKPGVSGVRHQALNEHLCLGILHRAGIRTASSQYLDFDGKWAIVERRFDRLGLGEQTTRLHSEDLCQALGNLYPYERDGGPHAKDICTLLLSAAGVQSRDRFVDALIGSYLIGSPDGHARNYSVLLSGSDVALAPLYDVASSLPYDVSDEGIMHQRTVAMSIGRQRQFGMIRETEWRRFFESVSLDPDRGLGRVRQLAQALPEAAVAVFAEAQDLPGTPQLAARMLPSIQRLCQGVTETPGRRPQPVPLSGRSSSGGRVWIPPHDRGGRPVRGHWRKLT
ncbi:HipA domain-containing protein [Luteococcus sp. H138]|uniref:HipA domain-containing protein n=1 Tax=unclassified Luteococcus TaxID=2639923 RepID=UPI00313E1F72